MVQELTHEPGADDEREAKKLEVGELEAADLEGRGVHEADDGVAEEGKYGEEDDEDGDARAAPDVEHLGADGLALGVERDLFVQQVDLLRGRVIRVASPVPAGATRQANTRLNLEPPSHTTTTTAAATSETWRLILVLGRGQLH